MCRIARIKYLLPVIFILASLLIILPSLAVGTETLITTGTFGSAQLNPSVWGNWIVWEDQRNDGAMAYSDIYAYNLVTGEERRLSEDATYCYDPYIYSDTVAWYLIDISDGSYHIIYYNLGTDVRQDLYSTFNTTSSVSISSGNIVWEENSGQSDIIMLDVLDNRLYSLTIDDITVSDQQSPTVSGDVVVWQDSRNGLPDIYMNDTATCMQNIITENRSNQWNPAISGQTVVWMDMQTGDWDILAYDIPTGKITNLTPYASSDQMNPAIYSDKVIWLDDRFRSVFGEYDIIRKDLTTGVESPALNSPTASISSTYKPSIYNNRIVWTDDRAVSAGGSSDIYLSTDGSSVSCPAASFTQSVSSGPPPLTVRFTDTSTGTPAHRRWDFGDSTTSISRNPSHTYSSPGIFIVNLTAGTPECRNMSVDHTISVGTPAASFIAFPIEAIAPRNVVFDSNATIGTVDTWLWDFGDTTTSSDEDPEHIYSSDGTYDVKLTATNTYGSNERNREDYITIRNGIRTSSQTTITGFTFTTIGNDQLLTVDTTNFGTNFTFPDPRTLVTRPAPAYGWQNITFLSSDGAGFTNVPPLITGNLQETILQTNDITPFNYSAAFAATYGDEITANYRMALFPYPGGVTLNTDIWEGTFPSDEKAFLDVTSHSGFTGTYIAYTVNTTRGGIGNPEYATVNMSVKTSWIGSYPGGVTEGRTHTFVIATGTDSYGSSIGTVLPAHFLFSSGDYDYFEAEIPANASYMSKFALALLSGSGNIFQFVSIGFTEHFAGGNSPSDSDSDTGPSGNGAGPTSLQNQPQLNEPQLNPPQSAATSVDLYINSLGVVTQTSVLKASDNLASVAVGQGVTALDASGNPLSSISIEPVPADEIALMLSSGTHSFGGLAYNLQPGGAVFSPSITITFTVPDARWSQQYSVREFDEKTGTWIDLPTTYNPESGTVSASVSHFCTIALFSSNTPAASGKTLTPLKTMAAPPEPIPTPATSSQMGILYNMIAFIPGFVAKNIYLILILIAIVAALYMRGRRGRLDRIRYNL